MSKSSAFRVHRTGRPFLQAGQFKAHGNYRADKTQPLANALSNASGVVKAGLTPITKESPASRVASPRRSGKWKAFTINSRLSYRGLDESKLPVWA